MFLEQVRQMEVRTVRTSSIHSFVPKEHTSSENLLTERDSGPKCALLTSGRESRSVKIPSDEVRVWFHSW